jgi:hypothetical protein
MTTATWTVEKRVHFRHAGRGRGRQVREGPAAAAPTLPTGRVPRVSRLMALALRLDDLVRSGAIASYAELARLGHVTRARVCQIMNLLCLAPDLQEAVLFLPRTQRGRDRVILADLQPIASTPDWRQQRRLWARLCPAERSSQGAGNRATGGGTPQSADVGPRRVG